MKGTKEPILTRELQNKRARLTVMALMLSDAKIASLSASVGSSLFGILADKITHISHRFTLTALRSARDSGEPCAEQASLGYLLFIF